LRDRGNHVEALKSIEREPAQEVHLREELMKVHHRGWRLHLTSGDAGATGSGFAEQAVRPDAQLRRTNTLYQGLKEMTSIASGR